MTSLVPFSRTQQILEALLFAHASQLSYSQIQKTLPDLSSKEIVQLIDDMNSVYRSTGSALHIHSGPSGWELCTLPHLSEYLREHFHIRSQRKLPDSVREVFAIILYRQPITKNEIFHLRQKSSDRQITQLLSEQLIDVVGRKNVPGRPLLYGSTSKALEILGINHLSELPKLEEIS